MSKAVVLNSTLTAAVEQTAPVSVEVHSVGTQGPPWIVGGLQDWESGKAFLRTHAVYHRGGTFRCIAAHTATSSTEPDQGANWALVWEQVSRPGQGAAALPLEIEAPEDGEILRFRGSAWTNEGPENLVDGGNF